MLANMIKMLEDAKNKGYAIPAPGVNDLQTIEATFKAALETKSPIILDCVERNDIEAVADITKFMTGRYPSVPAALNLDHGATFEICAKAIQAGFTSVMIDCSTLPFEENARNTAEVVRMAHAVGVSVEAELGHVGITQDENAEAPSVFTDPAEAVEFVRLTGVDALAVAVGTAHGLYKGDKPQLQYDLIKKLRKDVPVPLVLHGGSGTGDDELALAVRAGIAKINLFSDLSSAGTKAVKDMVNSDKSTVLGFLPLSFVYGMGVNAYQKKLTHYINVFGSNNKASI